MKIAWINLQQSASVMSSLTFKPARKYPAFSKKEPGLMPYISGTEFMKAMTDKEYAQELMNKIKTELAD